MAWPAVFSKGQNAQAWSPAHLYLLVSGVFHVFIGSVGLIYNSSFALGADARVDPEASGHVFGIFETNGWHNLAGLLAGLAALAFALKPERARFAALLLGAGFVIVTISLIIWDPRTFGLASDTADQVLHALAGIGGIASALATRSPPSSESRGQRVTLAT